MRQKTREKQMALELREQGLSYEEIRARLAADNIRVSIGSLNNWLSGVELSDGQKARLAERERAGGTAGRCKILTMGQARKSGGEKQLAGGFSG